MNNIIVCRESKPRNSDFYQTDFLSTWEYQTHGAHYVEFSLEPPLKSINHASKYSIFEKFNYFGAHFMEIQGFAMKKMLKMSLLDGFS